MYLDLSQQSLTIPPRILSRQWLREWLELYPEKVLFGTDGYPFTSSALGWEEASWIANRNAREALGLRPHRHARRRGDQPHPRAGELARMVLRGNAEVLYHF